MMKFARGTLFVFVLLMGLAVVAGCNINSPDMPKLGSVSLAWDSNSEADLGGYKLYYGSESGTYAQVVNVGKSTGHTVSGLQSGNEYYFALAAYSIDGLESEKSEEVLYTF